jgi:translation initiation factor 2B subunit (eIF-2B alpha/beta/delta family)
VKNAILIAITGMIDDIEAVHEMISSQALEHIHAKDVIMTYGRSNILTGFFEVSFRLS